MILEDPAMKLIAAAFGNRGDVANAAEFGSVVDFTHADFGDAVERRKKLCYGSAVPCTHGADAVDGDREHVAIRAGDRNKAVVVDFHARLRRQRAERARGAGRSRTERYGKIDQFPAELRLRNVGDFCGDGSYGFNADLDSLSLRQERHDAIHANRLPGQKL